MRKYQKIFMAGASLFMVCIMAIAGVLAIGSLNQSVTVSIHYNPSIAAKVYASTYSSDPANAYYQNIASTEAADFATDSSIVLYDMIGSTGLQGPNITAFQGSTASFKFDTQGILIFYFLIENNQTSAVIQYDVTFTYGVGEIATSDYVVFDSANSTALTDVVVPVKTAGITGKNLCKLVFNLTHPLETAVSFPSEPINIDIDLTKGTVA